MYDLIFISAIVGLFGLALGYLRLCEVLNGSNKTK